MEHIHIRMLGEFSLSTSTKTISDTEYRSKRSWSLLGYLIYNHGKSFSSQKLSELFWSGDSSSTNPENRLRITLHRLRIILDELWPNAGHELIIHWNGGYGWNPAAPVTLDCRRFEELSGASLPQDPQRLDFLLQALSLYTGDFLPRHASEMWVIPISTHFQNQQLQLTLEATQLLAAQERHAEAVQICRIAASANPYHEVLHQHLIQEMAALGDWKGASFVFHALRKRLLNDFGMLPNEETQSVYRVCVLMQENRTLTMEDILTHLKKNDGSAGAVLCPFDLFMSLCRVYYRGQKSFKTTASIVLINLTDNAGAPPGKQLQNHGMELLGDFLRVNLHWCDILSRCSASQYIIFFPGQKTEEVKRNCRRILTAFLKNFPHLQAKLPFRVHTLDSYFDT